MSEIEDVRTALHVMRNSQIVSKNFTAQGLTAAYVEALSALSEKLERLERDTQQNGKEEK